MEFLEVPLFDDDIYKMSTRFLFNLFFLLLVVGLAIYPNERKRHFTFTTVMMNVMVFFICFALKKLELELGMALGLFAIFGVLRYRTDSIRAKEMTYLFIVIGIAVINSLSNTKTSYAELLAVNFTILGTTMIMERFDAGDPLRKHTINYDKVNWLRPEHRAELLADLKSRTGFDVAAVEIKNLDLRKKNATLVIAYHDPNSSIEPVFGETELPPPLPLFPDTAEAEPD